MALAIVEVARELSLAGDQNGAFVRLEAGLEQLPDSFELRYEYGRAAELTERLALAIEAYEFLLEAEPDERRVARRLATTSLAGGFLEHARGPTASLLARDDASGQDFLLGSRLAFDGGELQLAEAHARRALELEPENPEASYQLARVLFEGIGSGSPEDVAAARSVVLTALLHTLELDPGHAPARFVRATLLLQAAQPDAGANELALRDSIRFLRGPRFAALAAPARIQRAREVSQVLRDWSQPWVAIARAQLELGQPVKAQESLERARQLRPLSIEAVELDYAAALARGQAAQAAQLLETWKEMRADDS